MKIIKSLPSNHELILVAGLKPTSDTVYCYGDTIYNPSGKELSADVEHHEYIHSKQQGNDPEAWWNEYLSNKEFRYKQELEAYGEQYDFAKEHGIRGALLKWALEKMALALSGQIYGFGISYGEAESKIRNYSK